MRRLVVFGLAAILAFSVAVLATSLSAEAKRVAGGSTSVERLDIKVYGLGDVVSGGKLTEVRVGVLVNIDGEYRVDVKVWNALGESGGSATIYLTAGQATIVSVPIEPPLDVDPDSGFSHDVGVAPA